MTTWYRMRTFVGVPEPVEVERETDKFVVVHPLPETNPILDTDR